MPSSSYSTTLAAKLSVAPQPADVRAARGVLRFWRQAWGLDPAIVLTIGSRLVGMAAGLVASVMTARYLQPAGRGEYFIVVTTAQLIAQFTSLGLPSSNTYFVARDRGLFSGLLANSVWISLVAVPVLGAAFLIFSPPGVAGALGSTTRWFAVALAPFFVFNLLGSGLFVGLNQLKTFSLMQAMSTAVALPFMLVAAGVGSGSRGFLAANLFGCTVTSLIMLRCLFRQSSDALRFSPDVFVATFKYSTKAYLATLAGFVVLRMNVFTLHAFAGSEQVGYYSVASQICDPIAILPQSIALVLFPRLAATKTGRLQATIRNAASTAVLLTAICVVAWALADPAIRFAFGPRFAPAAPVLRAMLPGVLLLGVMSVVSQYLAASGFPASVVAAWFAAIVLSAGLGRRLVGQYGAVGAAATLSVTYAVLLVGLLLLCWRTAKAGRRSHLLEHHHD